MTKLEEIKEAIIVSGDGALSITFGANLNRENENFHDNVSIDTSVDGNIIFVKGRKLKSIGISGEIKEGEERFKYFCEKLKKFEEEIEVTEIKKFSWRTFRKEVVKIVRSVWNSEYRECRYIYKEEFWTDREYKTNNWVFIEFKPEPNDQRTAN